MMVLDAPSPNVLVSDVLLYYLNQYLRSLFLHAVHGFHKVSFDAIEGVPLNILFGPYVKGESRFDSISLAGTVSLVEDTASEWFLFHVYPIVD